MAQNEVEILVVEDNPADVELTLHMFQRNKLANRVHVARDGEEALDFIFCRGPYRSRSLAEAPKLVLLDLRLPKVDGMEVLRILRTDARTQRIPVVILTASREETDLVNSYHLGVNHYIQKPVDFDQLRDCVREVGLYWLLVNEPPAEPVQEASLIG